jgi:hypothetical protein
MGSSMWRELISALTADVGPIGDLKPGPDFFPGATLDQLTAVERHVGFPLPGSLRDLLEESNGVVVTYGQHLIWNTDEPLQYNLPGCVIPSFGAGDAGSQRFLFFGDAGVDRIQFGFLVTTDGTIADDVYAWYPILNEQFHKASSLQNYIESWLSGRMSV